MVNIKNRIISEQYFKKTGTKVINSLVDGKRSKEVYPGPATDTFQKGIESIKVQKKDGESLFYIKRRSGIISAIFGSYNARKIIKNILKK